MFKLTEGKVIKILLENNNIIKLKVKKENKISRAIFYKELLGEVEIGDKVILNTTANALDLGTGGYDFVVCVLNQKTNFDKQGHIMKLRYTPYQIKTCAVAEQDSDYREEINKFDSLAGTPVLIGELHSMLAAATAVLRGKRPQSNISYIMTDGGALPIAFSDLVNQLKAKNLINHTITSGHSFGGDLEAINIYTALIAAKEVKKADIIIVIMGPGIVGTGTKYGFSGIEQANILHAVKKLGGEAVIIPRINFSDSRNRHFGLSHHTKTVLGELTLTKAKVGIPILEERKNKIIEKQLAKNKITKKHEVIYHESNKVIDYIKEVEKLCKTMGKSYNQAQDYFLTCGISALIASKLIKGGKK